MLTCSSATSESSKSCLIIRRAWVVQHLGGQFLDPQGDWTSRLELAWQPRDPRVAADRLRHLDIGLSTCRLVPVTLQAKPAMSWQWSVND